jgi:dienelactone hydrolase
MIRMKAPILLLIAAAPLAFAQNGSVQDSRNTNIPGTDTHFVKFDPPPLPQWEARKAHLRKQILFAAGLMPMPPRTPLNPHVFGRIKRNGYTVEKVYIETLPGYYLGGNLFRPSNGGGKHPGVLVAHGHWQYGRLESEPLFSGPLLGATLAQQGYVAFAYDMVGYNDTLQTPHEFGGKVEELWSFGPLGLQLWNSIRALDFLEGLSDVDGSRIGMTGASGGGTQTFLLAAVDDRVGFVAPANMVSAEMQGGDYCENAPGLRLDTFNVEIAAMAAPRPMALVSTSGDWTHNVPNFEYPSIEKVYALYGKTTDVSDAHFIFPHHNFNEHSRGAVYKFFQKYLTPDASPHAVTEEKDAPPRLQDMLVFEGMSLPPGAKTYDQLVEAWKQMSRDSLASLDTAGLRDELQTALAASWPERVDSTERGEGLVLSRPGVGDAVPAKWYPAKGAPVLIVDPAGCDTALKSEAFRSARASGHAVLCIDAFQTGAAKTERPKLPKFYLTFNRSDDQNRVQDILTALAFLKEKSSSTAEISASGRAGLWAVFAAAVAPVPVRLHADTDGFHGTDNEYLSEFFVPGIQRAGGIATASILLETRGAGKNP